jgi:hypothetical protein
VHDKPAGIQELAPEDEYFGWSLGVVNSSTLQEPQQRVGSHRQIVRQERKEQLLLLFCEGSVVVDNVGHTQVRHGKTLL